MPKKINIGLNKPVFVIAEISANHNSSLSTAKKMIVEAAKSGVSAVKIIQANGGVQDILDQKSL